MDDIGDLIAKLAAVDEALRALPDDAFAEKHLLLQEQDRLRDEAGRYAVDMDAERSDEELLAELGGLRSQLARLERQRIDLVTQAGGGAAGTANMGNLGGVALNAQMAEATGAGRLQARIGVIKGILADRGVGFPDPD